VSEHVDGGNEHTELESTGEHDIVEESNEKTSDESMSCESVVAEGVLDREDKMRLIVEGLLGNHDGGSMLYIPTLPGKVHEGVKNSNRVSPGVAENLVKSFAQLLGRERDGDLYMRLVAGRGDDDDMRAFSRGWIESGGDCMIWF
jgi:hypothetical protein